MIKLQSADPKHLLHVKMEPVTLLFTSLTWEVKTAALTIFTNLPFLLLTCLGTEFNVNLLDEHGRVHSTQEIN
jgi:hypothetical protein